MLIFKLALRNILRNRRRSLLTLLSITGAYALLAIMFSFVEGSYSNIINLFTSDHTAHVQIHYDNYLDRPSLYKTIKNSDELLLRVEQKNGVLAATSRIYAPSLAYGGDKAVPVQVVGINPEREAQTTAIKEKITQGQYLQSTNPADYTDTYYPAMIGFSLAKKLKLSIGDELILISQGSDGSIANDIFIVQAIIGTKDSRDRMSVYLPQGAMQAFISLYGQTHEIAIKLNNQKHARVFAQQLSTELNQQKLVVSPWQEVEQAFYKGMHADKQGNYVSMGIIIFIVSLTVLNTILMAMLERTREFGVMRAVGTQPLFVFRLIILESQLLALFSCVFGFIISFPFILWLSQGGYTLPDPIDMGGIAFQTMLGEMSLQVFALPVVVVFITTLVVSLIPAIKASRISPLQALQAV